MFAFVVITSFATTNTSWTNIPGCIHSYQSQPWIDNFNIYFRIYIDMFWKSTTWCITSLQICLTFWRTLTFIIWWSRWCARCLHIDLVHILKCDDNRIWCSITERTVCLWCVVVWTDGLHVALLSFVLSRSFSFGFVLSCLAFVLCSFLLLFSLFISFSHFVLVQGC